VRKSRILAISFCAKELVGWGSQLRRQGHTTPRFRPPRLEELLLLLCLPLAGASGVKKMVLLERWEEGPGVLGMAVEGGNYQQIGKYFFL